MFRVYRALDEIGPEARGCAVSIGNFDGVHAGHRRIMRRVAQLAREHGWTPSVLTFDPHPAKVVAPDRAPKLLTDVEERLAYMREEGIRAGVCSALRSRIFRADSRSVRARYSCRPPWRKSGAGRRKLPLRTRPIR